MHVTYRERDLPERLPGREYVMEDETEKQYPATVMSSRPIAGGLIEYELELPDDASSKSLHFVEIDDA